MTRAPLPPAGRRCRRKPTKQISNCALQLQGNHEDKMGASLLPPFPEDRVRIDPVILAVTSDWSRKINAQIGRCWGTRELKEFRTEPKDTNSNWSLLLGGLAPPPTKEAA